MVPLSRRLGPLLLFLTIAVAALVSFAGGAEEALPSWPPTQELSPISPVNLGKLRLLGQLGVPVIEEMAWSARGEHLALRSTSGVTVYRMDAEKGMKLVKARTVAGDRPPLGLAFGTRDDTVATCDGGKVIKFWDIRSGFRRRELKDAGAPVMGIALGSSSFLLAAIAADGKLRIWRDEELEESPQVLEDHKNGAAGISIDPKGQWAVTWAPWNKVHVWSLKDGTKSNELTFGTEDSFESTGPAAIAPGGILWVQTMGLIRRWKLPKEEGIPDFKRYPVSLGLGTFDPEGKVCVVHGDKGAEVVSSADGKSVRKLAPASRYGPAAFEPKKGKLLALVADGALNLLDVNAGSIAAAEKIGSSAHLSAVSPGGEWLIWGPDLRSLELVNLKKGGKSAKLSSDGDRYVTVLALDPKARFLATAAWSERKGIIWTAKEIRGGELPVLWQLTSGRLKRTSLLDGELDGIRSLAFSPDGEWLAMGTQWREPPKVKLFSLRAGKVRATVEVGTGRGVSFNNQGFAFDPKSKLLATSIGGEGKIFFIDVLQAKVAFDLTLPESARFSITNLQFSPQGNLLAAIGSMGQVLLYDVATKRLQRQLAVKSAGLGQIAFSPDGLALAGISTPWGRGGDEDGNRPSSVALFNLSSGSSVQATPPHVSRSRTLLFLEDGKLLLSAGYDGAIRLWGVKEEKAPEKEDGESK
jgi:WD40 repeat protein